MALNLMISDNTTEIINSPIEIITVPSSEDDREESGEDVPALTVEEVSEGSGDDEEEDLKKGEPEKGEPSKGDSSTDPEEAPVSDEDENEFTQVWG